MDNNFNRVRLCGRAAGEPLHREHKAVERHAVVDVRERGVGGNPSAEPDAVEVTVHVVHLVR